jgi:pimeloyl-ACP methyl ester carboxylesterase
MPEFGNDVVAVADQLGLSDMVLIGHSMGGDVIVEAALRLGDRVIGLVWVDVYRTLREEADPEDAVEEFLRPFHTDFQPRPTTSCGRCSRPAQLSTWPTGWQLTWRRLRHRWRSTR